MTPEFGVSVTVVTVAVFHVWLSLEALVAMRRGHMRLLFAAVSVDHAPGVAPRLRRRGAVAVGLLVRAAASLALISWFCATGQIAWPLLVLTCLSALHYAWFRIIGGDGSEQMALIVTIALAMCTGPWAAAASQTLVLCFLGAQFLLAYFSAGIAKLPSRAWRSGHALQGILATESHGSIVATKVLRRLPWVGKVMSWVTMSVEIAMPVAALASTEAAIVVVAASAMFHLGCSLLMGLNLFPIAFAACYPGVIHLAAICSGT